MWHIGYGIEKVIVRLGLLGVGFMGQVVHLDNYVRVPDCEVRAICDVRPKLLEAVASKYKIPTIYRDYREMLEDPDLDGIVCCQPPENTYPFARDVLSQGKHLLTQSPMATCLEDARELVRIAEDRGLVYGVGCMKRFDMGVERARGELARVFETADLGALLRADACCLGGDWMNEIRPSIEFPDEPPPQPHAPHYPDFLEEEWKPSFLEYLKIYSHNLNLIRYLLPDGKLECMNAVVSKHRNVLSHTTSLRFEDVPVCLRGTSSYAHEWQEETCFIFEKGRITVHTPTPLRMQASAEVKIYTSDGYSGEHIELHSPRLWAFMLQAAGFAGAVAGISSFRSPAGECMEDVALVEDIFRKAKFL